MWHTFLFMSDRSIATDTVTMCQVPTVLLHWTWLSCVCVCVCFFVFSIRLTNYCGRFQSIELFHRMHITKQNHMLYKGIVNGEPPIDQEHIINKDISEL